ncbi:MAG: DUF342 domain-containing protein, partial [Gammaproteobacteria bacterium]|nr:DUF342 domain-containing protein [Gammaproteobacteria bacterium]
MAKVQFCPIEDHTRVELHLQRGDEEDQLSAEQLEEQFLSSPYARYLPLENAFKMAADHFQQLLPGEDMPPMQVARSTDAQLRIIISRDKLSAQAEITQGYGGKAIKSMELVVAARKAGISEGLDVKAIGQLIAAAHELTPGAVLTAIIARGLVPVEGKDVVFEQLVLSLEDRVMRPVEKEDGYVDVKDYGKYASVRAGQPMMRRHPPVAGEPGISVLGRPIPCRPVKNAALIVGEGAQIAPDDADLLLAERDGVPRRLKQKLSKGMAVDEMLNLKNVDLASGNIDFDGTVIVDKDVAEDMRVIATGDICIGGLVESSHLQAGGSVFIGKGIIGRQIQET